MPDVSLPIVSRATGIRSPDLHTSPPSVCRGRITATRVPFDTGTTGTHQYSRAMTLFHRTLSALTVLRALPGFGIVWLSHWRHVPPVDVLRFSSGSSMTVAAMAPIGLFVLLMVTPSLLAAAPGYGSYRMLNLGDSVAAVVGRLEARPADVVVVQERPSLIETLTWRRPLYVSGVTVAPDPLESLVLTFHQGRLVHIEASYQVAAVEGLTDDDLTSALTGVYGAALLAATPWPVPATAIAPDRTIGVWGDEDVLVTLRRERARERPILTIASANADAARRAARIEGVALAAGEAPGKALALGAAQALESERRAVRVRRENQAAFKP